MNSLLKIIGCLILVGLAGCQRPDDVDPTDADVADAAAVGELPLEPAEDSLAPDGLTAEAASVEASVEAEPDDVEIEDDGRTYVYRRGASLPYLIRQGGVSYELADGRVVRAVDRDGREIQPPAAVTADIPEWVNRAATLRDQPDRSDQPTRTAQPSQSDRREPAARGAATPPTDDARTRQEPSPSPATASSRPSGDQRGWRVEARD